MSPSHAANWYPVKVLKDGLAESYTPITKVKKHWRVCVLLPHGKDKYWWGVTQGIDQDAKRLNVNVAILEAGGYDKLDNQRKQWLQCDQQNADAFVIASISQQAFASEIQKAVKEGKPVIDLVNGINSTDVTSRSELSFADMASAAGRYILSDAKGKPIKIAWFPGPKGAGWVKDAENGINTLFANANVTVIHGGYGPTDRSSQAGLIRRYFSSHLPPDFILGNAVAIDAAASFMRLSQGRSKLVSIYATSDIVNLIRSGDVMAAPSDSPVIQGRIALDLAVRALEGEVVPKQVSPEIIMLDHFNIKKFDLSSLLPIDGQRMILRAFK